MCPQAVISPCPAPSRWSPTHLFDLGQSVPIFEEEREVLVGDIHLSVATELPVLLLGVPPTGEGVPGDLRSSTTHSISQSQTARTQKRANPVLDKHVYFFLLTALTRELKLGGGSCWGFIAIDTRLFCRIAPNFVAHDFHIFCLDTDHENYTCSLHVHHTSRVRASVAHLVFDLLHGVCEEDGGGGVTGTHLGLGALQGWEERGVEESGLGKAQARRHVSRHTEVRVLDR